MKTAVSVPVRGEQGYNKSEENAMTVTIEIPDEAIDRVRAAAESEGMDVPAFAAALVLDATTATDLHGDDPQTIAEIGDALAEADEAAARGDYGRPIETAFAELDRRAADR